MAYIQSPSNPNLNANPNSKKPALCEECGENQSKYRCPGCGLVSCSLPCVKSHKERLGCTGKRSRTEFVPITEFDDKDLLSDYNFLEEAKQASEAARRIITGFGANYAGYLPPRLRMLKTAANRRRASLHFLPKGMSKRESNQSRFDKRRNCIYWTLEWRFPSVHATRIDHSVPETEMLGTLIEKHLSPTPWNDNLTSYRNVSLSGLRFFIQKCAEKSKSPYRELDINLEMCAQLRGVLILEHPVIHVLLPTEAPDFEIEKCLMPAITKDKDVGPLNQDRDLLSEDPAVKCRVYKEEEIEEGETESETRVVDLSEDATQNSKCGGGVEAQRASSKFLAVVSSAVEGSKSHNGIIKQTIEEEEVLDFDEEVKQAYSDLLGEIDPDDFLCFDDDGFIDGLRNCENSPLGFGEEELEEGEIPA